MATKKKMTNEAEAAQSVRPKRSRVKVKTGQLVAVPLLDGTFALAHVALYTGNIITAHFAHRADSPEHLREGIQESTWHSLFAIIEVTSDEIYDGRWAVIGYKEPTYTADILDMKGRSYTASATRGLFEAYYGLRPWDEMAVPRWYDRMLLPHIRVPPTARYKRDFEKDAITATTTAATASAATDTGDAPLITEGPCVIHIEIKYEGDGLPSIALLKRRQAIEEGLESAGVGEVTDAGGGGGVMDIYLETKDVAHAMPYVQAAIKEAGFEKDARIETEALDDEETEDDAD